MDCRNHTKGGKAFSRWLAVQYAPLEADVLDELAP